MTIEQTHHTSQTKTNPGIGEVTTTNRDCFQRHDKIHLLRIFAVNPDRTRLTPQCLIGSKIATRVTIYPMTRNS